MYAVLHTQGLSDTSERHRDTSKILEAMEKKFSTNNNTPIQNDNNKPPPPSPLDDFNTQIKPCGGLFPTKVGLIL